MEFAELDALIAGATANQTKAKQIRLLASQGKAEAEQLDWLLIFEMQNEWKTVSKGYIASRVTCTNCGWSHQTTSGFLLKMQHKKKATDIRWTKVSRAVWQSNEAPLGTGALVQSSCDICNTCADRFAPSHFEIVCEKGNVPF